MAICLFLYTGIAVTGYLRFTSSTCGDYLNNFANNDKIVTVGRIGLLLTLYCSFPLVVLPAEYTKSTYFYLQWPCCGRLNTNTTLPQRARMVGSPNPPGATHKTSARSGRATTEAQQKLLDGMFPGFITDSAYQRRSMPLNDARGTKYGTQAHRGLDDPSETGYEKVDVHAENADEAKKPEDSTTRHALLTLLLIGAALFLGLKVQSVVTIWSIAGSSVAMMIAYVLPAIFYIKLRSEVPFNNRILGAWVLLICSLALIVLTSWQAVAQISRPNCPERGKDL